MVGDLPVVVDTAAVDVLLLAALLKLTFSL